MPPPGRELCPVSCRPSSGWARPPLPSPEAGCMMAARSPTSKPEAGHTRGRGWEHLLWTTPHLAPTPSGAGPASIPTLGPPQFQSGGQGKRHGLVSSTWTQANMPRDGTIPKIWDKQRVPWVRAGWTCRRQVAPQEQPVPETGSLWLAEFLGTQPGARGAVDMSLSTLITVLGLWGFSRLPAPQPQLLRAGSTEVLQTLPTSLPALGSPPGTFLPVLGGSVPRVLDLPSAPPPAQRVQLGLEEERGVQSPWPSAWPRLWSSGLAPHCGRQPCGPEQAAASCFTGTTRDPGAACPAVLRRPLGRTWPELHHRDE
ncbi:uncharacterized protein LOC124968623 [Sciurus carolinensis]|uniref:uncharacterized protein LOC124968623 n=1 Tax=Sciurus carolinensis TaxID=30640 RepID=UPI001FB29E06|nr:uncharacterized protein LOC124968623 [Sciurus carolinensis]